MSILKKLVLVLTAALGVVALMMAFLFISHAKSDIQFGFACVLGVQGASILLKSFYQQPPKAGGE